MASPGNRQQRSRGISVLAGERAQGFLHASSGIGGLAVLLRQGAVHGSAARFRRSEDSAVAALAGWCRPDEVVRILGFLEGEHVCCPRMERACGSVRSRQLRVKDLDDQRTDHGEARDRALMLPESGTQPARAASRARAWWLKDQAEGRSGVALPGRLERR